MSTKMTIDGNTAASHVAYAFSEVAAIYPITPSSPMAEVADEWSAQGRVNMFGQKLRLAEMESEGGAAGAVHGSLTAGALTTTYTASQGLLLMIPNMYKIAGELLPTVFHVSARALAAHALNIFGDHSDVMACRQTGFAMLASNSVQEVMDLALVAHLSTLKAKVPFLHFFDGFRTSHEVSKIDVIDYDEMKTLVDMNDIEEFRKRALNPEHPVQRGTAQNADIYFQNRETANKYYNATPAIVQEMMDKVYKLTGRSYHLFDYVGAKDAENVIVLMGSGADAVEETINKMNSEGHRVGLLKVRLYRPFSIEHFTEALPKTVKKLAVLDRTKEPGSLGEPLYLDVCAALLEKGMTDIKVVGGRYGLGSKEFNPSMVYAVYKNLESKEPKNHFTVGIYDDLTNTSLDFSEQYNAAPAGTISCKFWGLGSDGTVGANKNSIKIIGDHTDKYVQGYFFYDSKKSGGITVSHLRFGDTKIQSAYLIDAADFVQCSNPSYITRYDMTGDLKEGGSFLLNTSALTVEQLEHVLPAKIKNDIANKHIHFYVIDAIDIAAGLGLKGRTNTILQSAFFKIANIIPYTDAVEFMKKMAYKSFSKKGDAVVQMNYDAIDSASANLVKIEVPKSWKTTTEGAEMVKVSGTEYFLNTVAPIIAQKGDKLPSSKFSPDGTVPTGTTQYEKRGVAVLVPKWNAEKCIQCNQCSFVCPHACIRPAVVKSDAEKPASFETKAMIGNKGYDFRIQVSPLDCMGCGVCANICPAKEKALEMVPLGSVVEEETVNYDYSEKLEKVDVSNVPGCKATTVKGSQFRQPLFEFSGACAGCGETPYVKVITQMFGDRMIVANATGCSSIYGGSAPTCPYTVNKEGHGPAWANSLFEDNAEFGYGINLAYAQRRSKLADVITKLAEEATEQTVKDAANAWLENRNDAEGSKAASAKLVALIENCKGNCPLSDLTNEIIKNKDCLVKKSIWIFGGDGWAYDIGYGGLDHVLASGEDVNVLVLDTEVYSNTGGQASKSTPTGSVAKFAAAGKRTKKKDLGMMAMSYGYVYVAQCAMGSNKQHFLNAIVEAEAYHGPSLVICYAPCINHGINMTKSQDEEKRAVECGYWQLYRYNPETSSFSLDSKEPTANYHDFLIGETRYSSLVKTQPQIAEKLFEKTEADSKARLEKYKKLAGKE